MMIREEECISSEVTAQMERKRILISALLCLCLCSLLFAAAPAAAEGMVVQDTSGIRDDITDAKYDSNGGLIVESGQYGIDIQDQPTAAPLEGAAWQAALDGVAALNGAETPTVWIDPVTGAETAVEVVYMGVGRSKVILNGQKQLVNTVDLKWETEAPEDKVLAMVDTPRDGYAWLRKHPNNSKKNLKIQQVRTNTVVRVIRAGAQWTLVDHDGMRAYIQTSALEFFCNDHTDFDPGVVSVKGRTQGRDKIHARSLDNGCRDLGEYKIGTPITVFDIIDDWAEVDIEGWHCRIMSKYVTLEKELASAD